MCPSRIKCSILVCAAGVSESSRKSKIPYALSYYHLLAMLCLCAATAVLSDSQGLCGREPTGFLSPWDFPGMNAVVSCHALIQGIFPTLECNPHFFCLLHWQVDSLSLVPPGKLTGQGLIAQLCSTLCNPWIVAHQDPQSTEFSRQEYWSGQPFPSPGDLPDSEIKPRSATLQADYSRSELPVHVC